jgi:hypothetical protein
MTCKKGDALSPVLFNFTIQFHMRKVQGNQGELELSGTCQLLVYVNDVNMLGAEVNTAEKTQKRYWRLVERCI